MARAFAVRMMFCAAPGAGAQASQFFTKSGLGGSLGRVAQDQVDRVLDHVLAGRHLADELLNPKDVRPLQDRLDLFVGRSAWWPSRSPAPRSASDSRC